MATTLTVVEENAEGEQRGAYNRTRVLAEPRYVDLSAGTTRDDNPPIS